MYLVDVLICRQQIGSQPDQRPLGLAGHSSSSRYRRNFKAFIFYGYFPHSRVSMRHMYKSLKARHVPGPSGWSSMLLTASQEYFTTMLAVSYLTAQYN